MYVEHRFWTVFQIIGFHELCEFVFVYSLTECFRMVFGVFGARVVCLELFSGGRFPARFFKSFVLGVVFDSFQESCFIAWLPGTFPGEFF